MIMASRSQTRAVLFVVVITAVMCGISTKMFIVIYNIKTDHYYYYRYKQQHCSCTQCKTTSQVLFFIFFLHFYCYLSLLKFLFLFFIDGTKYHIITIYTLIAYYINTKKYMYTIIIPMQQIKHDVSITTFCYFNPSSFDVFLFQILSETIRHQLVLLGIRFVFFYQRSSKIASIKK